MKAYENPHSQSQAFTVGQDVISKWVDSEIQYQISRFEANTESVQRSGMTIDSPLVPQDDDRAKEAA